MDRSFLEHIPEPGTQAELDREEAHHLARVRRAKSGDTIHLFDGAGHQAEARILEIDRRRVTVQIEALSSSPPDAPVDLTVATAVPKGPRMSDLVRACTEVGVAGIIPLITHRSVVRPAPGERSERLERVAREAAKQSGRGRVPDVCAAMPLDECLSSAGAYGIAVVTDAGEDVPLLLDALAGRTCPGRALLIVGPEGGLTPEEIERAREAGCIPGRLDGPIMRVETAAPTLSALLIHTLS